MESIHDPKNLVGISSLIDDDDINSEIDLGKIEQEIIQGAKLDNINTVDHAAEYKKEMERISQNLHISSNPSRSLAFTMDDDDGDDDDAKSVVSHHSYNSRHTSASKNKGIRITGMSSASDSGFGNNTYGHGSFPSAQTSPKNSVYNSDPQLKHMTNEEKRQTHISQVLGDIDDKELECIDKEREEDTKTSLLEQIDMLRMTLDDDGIDIAGVPVVTKNHSLTDIQNVYKILRLKNDRNRYCSFAEELILAGAYGLESLFDGEKVWFGSYRPDLVGWSSTVKVKLRRMRYETSTFVGEIMENYQMSAGMRLVLELLPSIFLYSRQRKIAVNDNFATDKDYKEAISQLNSLE
jgi:hypothetical protein